MLNMLVSMYAASLSVTFYEQQESHSSGGTVALMDGMLAELSAFVTLHRSRHYRSGDESRSYMCF